MNLMKAVPTPNRAGPTAILDRAIRQGANILSYSRVMASAVSFFGSATNFLLSSRARRMRPIRSSRSGVNGVAPSPIGIVFRRVESRS